MAEQKDHVLAMPFLCSVTIKNVVGNWGGYRILLFFFVSVVAVAAVVGLIVTDIVV